MNFVDHLSIKQKQQLIGYIQDTKKNKNKKDKIEKKDNKNKFDKTNKHSKTHYTNALQ